MRGVTSLQAGPGRRVRRSLLIAVVFALLVAGCGGGGSSAGSGGGSGSGSGSQASIPLGPQGQLSAVEYTKLRQAQRSLKNIKSLTTAGQLSEANAKCRGLGDSTQLLSDYQSACLHVVAFAHTLLTVGVCFKGISAELTSQPTKIFSCEETAAAMGPAATTLSSDVTPLNGVLQRRGLPTGCFKVLSLPPALASDLKTLATKTSSMVAAAKQQNLLSAALTAKAWGATTQRVGKDLSSGGKSLKVCPHA